MAHKKEKPGAALIVALGMPKKGKGPMGKPMGPKSDMMDEETGSDEAEEPELSEDFVDYASSAFPELEGDEARLLALKKAIAACLKSDY